MNKIIAKTIKKAYKHWQPNPNVRCYHYAAAFDNNKMIGFAQNNPIKFDAKLDFSRGVGEASLTPPKL